MNLKNLLIKNHKKKEKVEEDNKTYTKKVFVYFYIYIVYAGSIPAAPIMLLWRNGSAAVS